MQVKTKIIFQNITPMDIYTYEKDILSIAQDQPDEYWGIEHFLLDLPRKWDLSFALFDCSLFIAYAILSLKTSSNVHIHHFMVNKSSRGRGLGSLMLQEIERRGDSFGAETLTLKVGKNNFDAKKFYLRQGFFLHGSDNTYQLMSKEICLLK